MATSNRSAALCSRISPEQERGFSDCGPSTRGHVGLGEVGVCTPIRHHEFFPSQMSRNHTPGLERWCSISELLLLTQKSRGLVPSTHVVDHNFL